VRLVLGDCHRLLADALTAALTREGMTVTALATTPQQVLSAVARHQPDICLVATCLLATCFQTSGGIDVLSTICGRHPRVKVVMLAEVTDPAAASAAIENGAEGIIKKNQHLTDIVRTLARVHAGEQALDAGLALTGARSFNLPATGKGGWLLRSLTLREQEVLRLMMEGESSKQIARSLTITLSTARTHVQSVLVKLGAHSRLEATSMVAQSGLFGMSGHYSLGQSAQAAASG
jgi:two-component system, NarL family, nitrate/nitrite response regulator NarL